jgi:hypothetical protein
MLRFARRNLDWLLVAALAVVGIVVFGLLALNVHEVAPESHSWTAIQVQERAAFSIQWSWLAADFVSCLVLVLALRKLGKRRRLQSYRRPRVEVTRQGLDYGFIQPQAPPSRRHPREGLHRRCGLPVDAHSDFPLPLSRFHG